jgi:Ca-activated chloride channel family protein
MHIFNKYLRGVALIVFLSAAPASAADAQQVHIVPHPDHPGPHSIYLSSARISLEILRGVAHTTITQVFSNPNQWRAEGHYLFPLPEGATVTDFRLTMDGVPVKGEVLDADKARRIYLDIVRRIRDPALLEWVGSKVFQARIFPFDPGGERTLTLSYAQVLPQEGENRVFRYLTGQGSTVGGPMAMPLMEPAVAPQIRPNPRALRHPAGPARFVIEGSITENQSIRSIYSPTHELALEQQESTQASFSAEGVLHAREGFTLYYATSTERGIGMSVLTHRPEGEDGYFLLTITPGMSRHRDSIPKNVIFVLDTSGSMQEDLKFEQAVEALDFGLGTLSRDDRFGLVTYSSTVLAWQDALASADRGVVNEVRDYVRTLSAAGGTNIEEALSQAAALAQDAVTTAESSGPDSRIPTLTYVIFLTDGLPTVGESDPDALLEQAAERLPAGVRLFTWGVGYDVNAFLLDRLAAEHGGRSAYVEPTEDLEIKVSSFFKSVSVPVMADLELRIEGVEDYDLFPTSLPDLFEGGTITVMGRYGGSGDARIRLTGSVAGDTREVAHTARLPGRRAATAFLAPMWAQRKVGYLLEQIRLHGESEELKSEITELGERYGLVTPYTSYLVIEERMRMAEEMGLMDLDAPMAQAQHRMAREAMAANVNPSSSVYAGGAGSSKQSGRQLVQLSIAERAFQSATSFRQADFLKVQRIGEKTFRLDEESGAWREDKLSKDAAMLEVEIGSEAFLELLERHESLSRYASIGEQVELVLDGQGYRFILP